MKLKTLENILQDQNTQTTYQNEANPPTLEYENSYFKIQIKDTQPTQLKLNSRPEHAHAIEKILTENTRFTNEKGPGMTRETQNLMNKISENLNKDGNAEIQSNQIKEYIPGLIGYVKARARTYELMNNVK